MRCGSKRLTWQQKKPLVPLTVSASADPLDPDPQLAPPSKSLQHLLLAVSDRPIFD